ncbi:MAG: hypothetical protein ACTSRG_24640 [Candidatus Helarchaeota archaeon]
MKLQQEEVETFYRLYHSLLIHLNTKLNLIEGLNSREDFKKFSLNEIAELRDELYMKPKTIDSFINENTHDFSSEEIAIINNWKHFIKGFFYIIQYTKKHAIFLNIEDPPKAYGVLALNSSFEEILGPDLPHIVNAVILPFKNKIIYDSIIALENIIVGGNIRRNLNHAYQEAKFRFGVITSLPFGAKKRNQSDADKLRFYMKSKRNREFYQDQIYELMNKSPELFVLFHQEQGKANAKKYKKMLLEMGISNAWFAVLYGIIVASGKSKKDVEQILHDVVPSEKRELVHIFKI